MTAAPKPKANMRKGALDADHERDNCQTPAYALDPLLPYLPRDWRIWEPAAGEGAIVRALGDAGYAVTGSDVQDGRSFFAYRPDAFDCLVTNPPYSIKYDWLAHCYRIGKPFALLVPVETIGAKQAQRLMERHGFELLLLDRRVNFKMPRMGFDGGGANFPVLWLCWQLLPRPVVFGRLTPRHDDQLALLEAA